MKLRVNGWVAGHLYLERFISKIESSRLMSYADLKNNTYHIMDHFNLHKESTMSKVNLFLDSGAFSAFSQGITIDIQEYIQFIEKYKEHLEVYAVLDVIGDPRKTYLNQITMEKAGLNPLPCFHYGEDVSWLDRYLSRGYEYIALGGMVPIPNASLYPWLDDLFSNYLTDSEGMPAIKVHGFGMTSFDLMLRYPWYSVDSTSWIITGRTGGVYVPAIRSGKLVYSEAPFKVSVSNRSPDSAVDPDHIDCMPPRIRGMVLDYFSGKGYSLGKSEWFEKPPSYKLQEGERWCEKKAVREKAGKGKVERVVEAGLSNDYRKRDELNIIYYADLEKSIQPWPWPFKLNKKKRGFGL